MLSLPSYCFFHDFIVPLEIVANNSLYASKIYKNMDIYITETWWRWKYFWNNMNSYGYRKHDSVNVHSNIVLHFEINWNVTLHIIQYFSYTNGKSWYKNLLCSENCFGILSAQLSVLSIATYTDFQTHTTWSCLADLRSDFPTFLVL